MGKLSQAQMERVREYAERTPLLDEMRDRDRKRLQGEVLAVIRARQARERLPELLANWERGRDPPTSRRCESWRDQYFALLMDIDHTLSPEQRAPRARQLAPLRGRLRGAGRAMNDPKPLRSFGKPPPEADAGEPTPGARATPSSSTRRCSPTSRSASPSRASGASSCAIPKFAEMFGYGPDELIGKPGEVVYPSRESYLALGQIAVPMLGGRAPARHRVGGEAQGRLDLRRRMIAKAIDPANPQQGTVWIVEDITERRRHADEVARLLREQEAILGTASIGIVFVKDRRIVRCNRRYEEMYGYGPGELDGKPTSVLYAEPRAISRRRGSAYDQLRARRHRAPRRAAQAQGRQHVLDPRRRARGRSAGPAQGLGVDRRGRHRAAPRRGRAAARARRAAGAARQRGGRHRLQPRAQDRALQPALRGDVRLRRRRGERRLVARRCTSPRRSSSCAARPTPSSTRAARTRASSGCAARTARASGAASRAARSPPAIPARGYVWLLEDITERRRADEALERLVREQDAVLQNAVTGIIFVKDRRIVRCNRRFEEIFGYGHGELLNRSTRFMFATQRGLRGRRRSAYEPVWRGETVYVERRHVRKDGTLIWCSLSGRAVQPGDPAQGSVWLFDDITQEHESEERVQRALAEQELILDNASVGIAFVRNRAIQRCNRFLEDMVGAGPGELIGQSTASAVRVARRTGRRPGGARTRRPRPAAPTTARRASGAATARTFMCRARGRRTDTGRRGAGMDLELRGRHRSSARRSCACSARSPSRS